MHIRATAAGALALTAVAAGSYAGPALAATHPTASATKSYSVRLKGTSERPRVASKATARARIKFNATKGTVTWRFTKLKHLAGPTSAYIGHGAAGARSTAVLVLGTTFKAKGTMKVSKALIKKIEASPKSYNVVLRDKAFPTGAARGQL
jgi:hypothetical protein